MNIKSSRWIIGAATAAALLSAIQLCSMESVSTSRSLAAAVLFTSSFFGFQRFYAGVADALFIAFGRAPSARTGSDA